MEQKAGMDALERLGAPEAESRTPDFDGRRLVRIDGGYLCLNYDKYRQKDHTAAERSKRYRERAASRVTNETIRVTGRSVTQEEGEAQVEAKTEVKSGAPSALSSLEGFEQTWLDFIAMRKKLRKPMTHRAETLIYNKLIQRPAQAIAALETCIEKGWQSFEWDWLAKRSNGRKPQPAQDPNYEITSFDKCP